MRDTTALVRTLYDVHAFNHEAKEWFPVQSGLPSEEAESVVLTWQDSSTTPILWPAEWSLSPSEHYGQNPPTFDDAEVPQWFVCVRRQGEQSGRCAMLTDSGQKFVQDWLAEQRFPDNVEIDVRCDSVCHGIEAFSAPEDSETSRFLASEIEPAGAAFAGSPIASPTFDSQLDGLWDGAWQLQDTFRENRPAVSGDSRALLRNLIRMLSEMHEALTSCGASATAAPRAGADCGDSLDHLLTLAKAGKRASASGAEKRARRLVLSLLENAIGLDARATVGILDLIELIQSNPTSGRDSVREAIR